MKNLSLESRAYRYSKVFPSYPKLVVDKGWLYGVWVLGRIYKSKKGYYGEYPPHFLKRVHSLFSDAENVLHLFSGSVEKNLWEKETLFDINPDLKPDVVGEAHCLASYFENKETFDLIIADPPYSIDDAERYGTSMISRNKVVKECYEILEVGGYLCWLDQVFPMYKKIRLKCVGTIGIIRSVNHRIRMLSMFERLPDHLQVNEWIDFDK